MLSEFDLNFKKSHWHIIFTSFIRLIPKFDKNIAEETRRNILMDYQWE